MPRLIFTVTSGRSGTGFLAKALGLFPDVHAEHEPLPRFDECMRLGVYQPEFRKLFLSESKLPFIAHRLHTSGKSIYAETSHLACKGFIEPLMELGVRPDMILLSRDPRKTALSLLRLNTIPGRNYRGLLYYKAPEDSDCFLPVEDPQALTPYQCCFWYTQEIIKRQEFYGEKLRAAGAIVLKLPFEEMVSGQGLQLLWHGLNLPEPSAEAFEKFDQLCNRPVNTKTGGQKWVCPFSPEELDLQESAVLSQCGTPE